MAVNPRLYAGMGVEAISDWNAAAANMLQWWHDAGVETLADEAPRDWLARLAPPPSGSAAVPAAEDSPPLPLAEFVAWRMGAAAPEAAWMAPMLPPAGPAEARLMVLTDMPEPEDGATGALLSGAAGRLFDRMLAAIGHSRESIYLAPLAFARPLTGQIPSEAEARLAQLARHHIALVGPERLLLLGRTTERVLSATGDSATGHGLPDINQNGRVWVSAACLSPRHLLERPAGKATAWKELQRLLSKGHS